jgi:hypothetical protein
VEVDKVVQLLLPNLSKLSYPIPVCWQFREQEFDVPSEGATVVALEVQCQYVSGTGTHA